MSTACQQVSGVIRFRHDRALTARQFQNCSSSMRALHAEAVQRCRGVVVAAGCCRERARSSVGVRHEVKN